MAMVTSRSFVSPPSPPSPSNEGQAYTSESSAYEQQTDVPSFTPINREPLLPATHLVRFVESQQELANRSEDHLQWRVEYKNKQEVRDKIKAMEKDGIENVMVMADFDHTLSSLYVPDGILQERVDRL